MSEIYTKIRYMLRYYFDNDTYAAKVRKQMCWVQGEGALSKTTARRFVLI